MTCIQIVILGGLCVPSAIQWRKGLWLQFRGEGVTSEWGLEVSRHIYEVSFLDGFQFH